MKHEKKEHEKKEKHHDHKKEHHKKEMSCKGMHEAKGMKKEHGKTALKAKMASK